MTAIEREISPAPARTVRSRLQGRHGRTLPYRDLFKRVLDLLLVTLSLPIVVPVVALLALVVALDGGKPFYRQIRVGRDGRHFTMWKLRSMVPDAEAELARYLEAHPEQRHEWDTHQKLRHDPRITRIGHVLRASSMDELPQLWNVLTGDMSLVGPRPMMPCQQVLYPGDSYYNLRPGITGFWQVSRRNESTFAARAEYDAAYERAVSFRTDVRVLLATVRVVLSRTGM